MKMNAEELHTARDVLGYYGLPGGYSPGSFTSALLKTLEVSDWNNRCILLAAFPHFIPAVGILRSEGSDALVEAVAEAGK